MKIFGERLKEARVGMGLTQLELAVRAGVLPGSIASYEHGRRIPKIDSLVAIAQELHRSTDWLCGLEG